MKKIILLSLSFILMGMLFNRQKSTAQKLDPTKQYVNIQFSNFTDEDLSFEYNGLNVPGYNTIIVKAGGRFSIAIEKREYDFHIFMVNPDHSKSFDYLVYAVYLEDEKLDQSQASYTMDLVYTSYVFHVINHQ